jgi:hypothetical protein
MSKRETPMTRRYWERVGGTLIEEFVMVPRGSPENGWRAADGLIIVDGKKRGLIVVGGQKRIASQAEFPSLDGLDVIVIQTKAARLGMYLLGQARYSPLLIKRRWPKVRSVRSVALCAIDDAWLRPLAEADGIEVVVDPKGVAL